MVAKIILSPGRKFGRWKILSGPTSIRNRSHYQCRCRCGITKLINVSYLLNGSSQSCGCLNREITGDRCRTHGDSSGHGRLIRRRLYRIWQAMIGRCCRPKHSAYAQYGARGITICAEWRTSYIVFRDWAVANGYTTRKSIDRIDNDGNYEPRNCRWATARIQANNKRNNRLMTAWGETKTIAEWSRDDRCIVNLGTIDSRIRRGYPIEDAITKVAASRPIRAVVAFGETKSISEWARDHRAKASRKMIERRLHRGWVPEDAISWDPKR